MKYKTKGKNRGKSLHKAQNDRGNLPDRQKYPTSFSRIRKAIRKARARELIDSVRRIGKKVRFK